MTMASQGDPRLRPRSVPGPVLDVLRRLGEGGHRANERAQGREGGRVVRKLLAEWIEAPVQRRASLDPKGYRRCREVPVNGRGRRGRRKAGRTGRRR